jgi:hypothetical protein
MSFKVIGKVELEPRHLADPEQNGIPLKTRVGIDLKAIDEAGNEMDSEAVIKAGLAWTTKIGLRDEDGNVSHVVVGVGAQRDADGHRRFPPGHPAEGKAVPNPGYELDGPGISALEHSNGFRCVINMRVEGYFTAFGSVNGVEAQFPKGKTFRVGKARPRRHG